MTAPETDPIAELSGHIEATLAALAAMPDAIARERAARRLVDEVIPNATRRLAAVRREVVVGLRDERYKLREIGEMLGLSVSRVNQIARGNK
ncbi:sigma factor-like helix-turn-helix DNA-binding protein [Streptomyces avicenniae]|uniref:sigma factor-like helix-turn-helix DNA-binding protein n=1 Tax=Streptomyces avicenniae TaxID=500153 RepID=UPI00069934D5|nr:sigma factor-like helix-turn-helix DNA-binding protein [Streptomyces avicenniae]